MRSRHNLTWIVLVIMVLGWAGGGTAWAHVGNPNVVFEGRAGGFPVRVVIRQPEVVPGLAEIHIRVLDGKPERVTALPMHSNTGRSGAPKPDVAQPVRGDPTLYHADLWLMSRGAYGVEVRVEGGKGGSVMVPVNSLAYTRKPMPAWLLSVTFLLCATLAAGLIAIATAGFREASLGADTPLSSAQRRKGWMGAALATVVVAGAVYGGNLWRKSEDENHMSRVLYQPLAHSISLVSNVPAARVRLDLTDRRATNRVYALIPDHGKLVHQFLIGPGNPPAFAHLHPVSESRTVHSSALPSLPSGRYRVFTDLAHEGGISHVLTNEIDLPLLSSAGSLEDPDDSWHVTAETGSPSRAAGLGEGLSMALGVERNSNPAEGVTLVASVRDARGSPVLLEPYLRMLGHAVIMRDDGGKFAHIHPSGTLSMAAARRFAEKADGTAAGDVSDVVCGDLAGMANEALEDIGRSGTVRFPFVFPTPGRYWLWVQVRIAGSIRTAVFEVTETAG